MESSKKIYEKLLEFQTSIETIKKDGKNPFFKKQNGQASSYATLPHILCNVKPILNALKIVLTQPIESGEVFTILTDTESGDVIRSAIKLPDNLSAQQAGSAITYFRRYTLCSLLSLEIDEDDDGNLASKVYDTQSKSFPKNDLGDDKPWLNDKQFTSALERINKGEAGVLEKIKATFKIKKDFREKLEQALKN